MTNPATTVAIAIKAASINFWVDPPKELRRMSRDFKQMAVELKNNLTDDPRADSIAHQHIATLDELSRSLLAPWCADDVDDDPNHGDGDDDYDPCPGESDDRHDNDPIEARCPSCDRVGNHNYDCDHCPGFWFDVVDDNFADRRTLDLNRAIDMCETIDTEPTADDDREVLRMMTAHDYEIEVECAAIIAECPRCQSTVSPTSTRCKCGWYLRHEDDVERLIAHGKSINADDDTNNPNYQTTT